MIIEALPDISRFQICDAARFNEQVCVIPEKIKESLKSGVLAFAKGKMKASLSTVMDGYNISFLVVNFWRLKNCPVRTKISQDSQIQNPFLILSLEKGRGRLWRIWLSQRWKSNRRHLAESGATDCLRKLGYLSITCFSKHHGDVVANSFWHC